MDKVNTFLNTKSTITSNHYITSMRSFLRYCIATRKIRDTPLLGIKKGKFEKKLARRAVTKAEFAKLVDQL